MISERKTGNIWKTETLTHELAANERPKDVLNLLPCM